MAEITVNAAVMSNSVAHLAKVTVALAPRRYRTLTGGTMLAHNAELTVPDDIRFGKNLVRQRRAMAASFLVISTGKPPATKYWA